MSFLRTITQGFKLRGSGRIKIELRPSLNYAKVSALGKPTAVVRGAVFGMSLPIYAANDEELFFHIHVPFRWERNSDLEVHICGYSDTVNDTKNFKQQVSWQHYARGGVVPNTTHDVEVQEATGTAAQYTAFHTIFTIDYDVDGGGSEIAADEHLGFRLRRIAASANEIAGEYVVTHFGLVFTINKIGQPV